MVMQRMREMGKATISNDFSESMKDSRSTTVYHIDRTFSITRTDGDVPRMVAGTQSYDMTGFTRSDGFQLVTRYVEKTLANGLIVRRYTYPWNVTMLIGDGVPEMIGHDIDFFRNRRIGVFGAACSGKTTFARTLANHLNVGKRVAADTPYEAATEWIQLHGIPDFMAQVYIFNRQLQLEDGVLGTGKVAVIDSPFPLTYIYARFYTFRESRRHPLYFSMMEKAARGMDLYQDQIYLPPLPWVNDGVRYNKEGVSERDALDNALKQWLHEHGTDVITVDRRDDDMNEAICRSFFRQLDDDVARGLLG